MNTAQRIESHGAPNVVNLSKEAWKQVAHYFLGRSLGIIDVKGKGPLEIMATRGRKTEEE